jgi:type III effector protein AvrRps4
MISSDVRAHTIIKCKSSEDSQTTKDKVTASARHDSSILSRAFAAQRLEMFEQPSSSRDLRLIALDKLQQRDFRPALGGLEIPLTGKAMGGMPKRINAPFRPSSVQSSRFSSSSVSTMVSSATRLEFGAPVREKLIEIEDKSIVVADLRDELAGGGLSEAQTRLYR